MGKECQSHTRISRHYRNPTAHQCRVHHKEHQSVHGLHQATHRNSRWPPSKCRCSNRNNILREARPLCQHKPYSILMANCRRLLTHKIQSLSTQYPAPSTDMLSIQRLNHLSQEAACEEDSCSNPLDRTTHRHRCSSTAWLETWGLHHHKHRSWGITCHDRAQTRPSHRPTTLRHISVNGR